MKSAKCVRMMDETATEDQLGVLKRYESAAQGNATSPRGSMKEHHKYQERRRVGGTNNVLTAMLAPATRKLCRVIKHEVDTHEWRNGVMVRTSTVPTVTHTALSRAPQEISLGTLIKRADRLDMTIVEYCEYIGYTGPVGG